METQKSLQSQAADDPKARELLRRAFERTARWQKDFKGFTADLTVNINGKESKGTITVKGPRDVTVQLPDAETQKWVESQIAMIAVHRGHRSFEESDGKYSLTLGDDRDHPMGPKLILNGDPMQSFIESRTTGSRKSTARWAIPACRRSALRSTSRTAP